MTTNYCSECGQQSEANANYCERCGQKFEAIHRDVRAADSVAPSANATRPVEIDQISRVATGSAQYVVSSGRETVAGLSPVVLSSLTSTVHRTNAAIDLGAPAIPDIACPVCLGKGSVERAKKLSAREAKKEGKDANFEPCLSCNGRGRLGSHGVVESSAQAKGQRERVEDARSAAAELALIPAFVTVPARAVALILAGVMYVAGGVAWFWGMGTIYDDVGALVATVCLFIAPVSAPVAVFVMPLYAGFVHGDWAHAALFYSIFVGSGIPAAILHDPLRRGFVSDWAARRQGRGAGHSGSATAKLARLCAVGIIIAIVGFAVAGFVVRSRHSVAEGNESAGTVIWWAMRGK